ncbi:MAG: hypothetical protein NZM28_06465, partial [Fimbriimonadales bacterium]|nr:hypothetical protein [Fimbriimonadales bacterium]
ALPRPAPAASVPQLPQTQQVGALTVEFRGLKFADYSTGDRLGTFLAPDIRILHAGKPLTGWDSPLFDLVAAGSPDKSFALGLPSADAPAWTVRLYINCYDINKLVQDAFSDYFDVTVAAPRPRQVVPIQRALQIEGAQLKVLALVGAGVLRYRTGEPLPRSVQNALAWREAGDMQQFKATMRDCLRQYRQSKDPATLTYLGLLCTAAELPSEEFQPLIAPLKALVQKEPKIFAYRIALGAVLTRTGRAQEALSLLQELNSWHSFDGHVLMWYALAFVETGQREEAKRLIQPRHLQHWRSVHELDVDKLRSAIISLLVEEYERKQADAPRSDNAAPPVAVISASCKILCD